MNSLLLERWEMHVTFDRWRILARAAPQPQRDTRIKIVGQLTRGARQGR